MSNQKIISQIKEKKELSGISDGVVERCLRDYLQKNKISLEVLSEKEKKFIIKEIRSILRNYVGRFQKTLRKKSSLVVEKNYLSLLRTHSSTEERIQFYPKLIEIIKQMRPKSILDLGCGLNPIALASNFKKTKYFASEINELDLALVQKFFEQEKISGETFVYDLKNAEINLPKTDLCLIFKVLDVIDPSGKKRGTVTRNLLAKINSKTILVSFSTKKLSGKRMNHMEREWFERILYREKYFFKKFYSDNELFYLIKKSKV